MKGFWLFVGAAVVGAVGCGTTPKRPMRSPAVEEFTNPAEGYSKPPDIPNDGPGLVPKSGTPMPMGPGLPGPGAMSPGMTPAMGPAGGMIR